MFNSQPDAVDRKESMGPIFNEPGLMEFKMGGKGGGWGQFENETSSGDSRHALNMQPQNEDR